MHNHVKFFASLLAGTALLQLGGCATPTTVAASGSSAAVQNEAFAQQVLALTTERQRFQRLNNLYWPLRKSNAELCGEATAPSAGFTFLQKADLDRSIQQPAQNALGVTDQVTVYVVAEGSPAWNAGLRPGDQIFALNDQAVGAGRNETRKLSEALADLDGQPFSLQISRNKTQQTLSVAPERVCAFNIVLDSSDALNAYADGTNIYITAGMYRFVDTDQELQLVIAHELAHNSEGHINKKLGNSLLGSVLDIAAAAYGVNTGGVFGDAAGAMYSQEFETEADYVGLYMMARAGITTVEAANFWRRMAAESPDSIRGSYGSSHPATSERWVAIDAAEREISAKKAAGQDLLPTREQ